MTDASKVQPYEPNQYAFAHRNRSAVHCHYCGCETKNPVHARDSDGNRIKVCRKNSCISKRERPA